MKKVLFTCAIVSVWSGLFSQVQAQEAAPGKRLETIISKLDKNRDGMIGVDEMPEKMQSKLAAADTNADGLVDRAELESAMQQRRSERQAQREQAGNQNSQISGERVQKLFTKFDANGDGALDLTEFQTVVQQLKQQRGPKSGDRADGNQTRGQNGKKSKRAPGSKKPQHPVRPQSDAGKIVA